MKNKFVLAFLTSVIILTGITVGYGIYINKSSNDHVEKLAAAQYLNVVGAKAVCQNIAPVVNVSSCYFDTPNMLDIHAQVGGTLSAIYVSTGEKVKAGQVLAEVVNEQMLFDVRQAQEKINEARVTYIKWDNMVVRYQQLINEGGISRQQLEEAIANKDVAASDIALGQDSLAKVQSKLKDQTITAPQDGAILKIYKSRGAVIDEGNSLLLMGDFSKLFWRNNMRDDALKRILSGSSQFKLLVEEGDIIDKNYDSSYNAEGQHGDGFDMRLFKIQPPIDIPAQYRSVTWEIDNPGYLLEPGTYYQVKIGGVQARRTLAIPKDALIGEKQEEVFVVTADNLLDLRKVELGVQDDNYAEILSGLSENEVVVVSGKVGLSQGMKVHVTFEIPKTPNPA